MKKNILASVLFGFGCCAFAADLVDIQNVVFKMADRTEAAKLLTANDEFTDSLTAFDRSARLQTSKPVSKKEYLDFIGKQALGWTEAEQQRIQNIIAVIRPELGKYNFKIPRNMYLVKTTGREEGEAAYCRNQNIIVFPQKFIEMKDEELKSIFIHELFHIYSKKTWTNGKNSIILSVFIRLAPLLFPMI